MKKFIITLVLAAMPFVTFAQTTAFDKFEEVDGIESMTISKDMVEMLTSMKASVNGDKTQSYIDMIEGLDNLKIFTTSEKKYRKEIKSAVTDYLKGNTLEQLMSYSGDNAKVKVYVNKGGDASIIKEGLVFIEDVDDKGVVLLSFTGNINLKKLEGLKNLTEKK